VKPDGDVTVPAERELVVVKLGGTTVAEDAHVLDEVATLSVERDVVVVHGGGKRLTEWLDRLGVESRFHDGLRVTDDATLEVALAVLRGIVNTELVAALRTRRADAVGVSGVDGGLLAVERLPHLGRVASVVGVAPAVLYAILAGGKVPVVAPLAADEDGVVCNVNADDVAAGLAGGLQATLVLLTDSDGVLDANGRRIASLGAADAERLIEANVISGGMVPKVRSGLRALTFAGAEAVIADGGAPAALTRALEDSAFGTRLRRAEPSPEREARVR
jgi:acetylglutamate kinase